MVRISAAALIAGVLVSSVVAQDSAAPVEPGGSIILDKCLIRVVDRSLVAAQHEGVVSTLEVAIGDTVEKDQSLLLLGDDVARATLALAEAEAANDVDTRYGQAVVSATKIEFERMERLKAQRASNEKEYNRARLEYDRATFSLEQAHMKRKMASLEATQAKANLEGYRVKAPFSGTITRVLKAPGESVINGEPVFEVVSTDRVQIEGYAHVQDVWQLQRGTPVTVELNSPELAAAGLAAEPCEGKIVLVDVVVQPVTETVRVVAEVKNRDNLLRDGLKARMVIDTTRKPEPMTAAAPPATK